MDEIDFRILRGWVGSGDYFRFMSLVETERAKLPTLPPSEIQKQATNRSYAIHAAYRTLGNMVERHEQTIQTRWMKKSKQKRLGILLNAWPGMAPSIHPDWDRARDISQLPRRRDPKYRDGYLWPSFNQEALLKPKSLLLLLHARARNHPSHFAAGDIASIHFAIMSLAVLAVRPQEDGNDYLMLLNGATEPDTYGKLVPWDESDPQHRMRCGTFVKQFAPGEGLLILEIQERILKFLLACCRALLPDISPADLTCDLKFPIQPPPLLKTNAETDGFASLAVMAAETPYRLPAHIDFARMERVLEARAAAAADHIWAMREDPAYFVDCIAEFLDHREEVVRDTDNKLHPMFRKGRESVLRSLAIRDILVDGFYELEFFTELHKQAKELHLLYQKHADHLDAAHELPEELLDRLLTFRRHLRHTSSAFLSTLWGAAAASPPLRRFFARLPVSSSGIASDKLVRRDMTFKGTKIEAQLLRLIEFLSTNGICLHWQFGLSLILDELQHLLESEPEAASLVSSRLAEIISDLSIVAQCRDQLNRFQPWARTFESSGLDRKDALRKSFGTWLRSMSKLMERVTFEDIFLMVDVLGDSQKRFHYPADRRPTRENIESLRNAEKNLDAFWGWLDVVFSIKCDEFRGRHVGRVLAEKRTLCRIPEWVDNSDSHKHSSGKKAKHQKTGSATDGEALCQDLAAVQLDSFEPAATNLKAQLDSTEKTKIKTKGLATGSSPPTEPATPATTTKDEEQPKPPTVAVDARALKVFRTLFFNPGVTSSPGEVPWLDFVHAMTSTGQFTAEKLYGSAWQFQRRDGEGQSSIHFHEPHPRAKIHFTMARRMGRRLNRTFGWTGSTFVLRKNDTTA